MEITQARKRAEELTELLDKYTYQYYVLDDPEVSDYEFHLPRPSYMFHTLEHLRQDYPEREFILIIGADNWERFPMWYKSEEILSHHRVIVYPRSGCELKNIPEGVTIADTPLIDISSTEIREKISNPDYHGEDLPPAVWEEIKKKKYYYED